MLRPSQSTPSPRRQPSRRVERRPTTAPWLSRSSPRCWPCWTPPAQRLGPARRVRRRPRGRGSHHEDPRGSPAVRRGARLHVLRDDRDVWGRGVRRPATGRGARGRRTGWSAGHQWGAGCPRVPGRPRRPPLVDRSAGPAALPHRRPRAGGPRRAVVVEGRADDVVQVAGASVSLGAVRAVLEADPRVAAAEVVALPDPEWGSRLVAAVVPAHPAERAPRQRWPTSSATSWSRRSDASARPRAIHTGRRPADAGVREGRSPGRVGVGHRP